MHRSKRALTFLAAAGLGLGLAGCGSDDPGVGAPGDKAKASRVIEVVQNDTPRFLPAFIPVKPNETVTFRITNRGTRIHEFYLGDEDDQKEREQVMKDMGSAPMNMADKPNGVTVDPGATKEITWSFPQTGTIPFGCHEPGDFDKGMKGEIKVSQ